MPAATAAPPATALVLLVSADASLQRSLCLGLVGGDYRIELATNQLEATLAIGREHPHLVVLDLDHPAVDAAAVAQMLVARGPLNPLILAGSDQDRVREQAVALGAVAFLMKPFLPGPAFL